MKILIENPCHENWDAMSPNEKGSFCLSCQKNVIDFTKKSLTEIKDFFTGLASSEKVCGRFETKQLDALNFEDFFRQFKGWILLKKIALVFFFVFGLSLFGSAQHAPKEREIHMLGEIYIPSADTTKKPKKDTLRHKSKEIRERIRDKRANEKKGEVKVMGKPAVRKEQE
jgi:hypothetical protein